MSLKVAIDLSCLEARPETGVERYARRLAEFLPVIAPDLEVTLLVRPGGPTPRVHPAARLVTVSSHLPRPLWREASLPRELARLEIPLLHAPVAAVPLRSRVSRVATIHDVPPLSGPEAEGLLSRNRLRMLHAAGFADALIVPSAATRKALLGVVPSAEPKVHVIPHGVDPDFGPDGVPLDRSRYGIPEGPYVLSVGTIRKRKDPLTLVAAFASLAERHAGSIRLVMCGDLRMDRDELLRPLRDRGITDRLVLTGYANREDLPDLYREAELVVLPSRLEGFGLCALEAMACGRPLVVSGDAALRELTGEAAVTFPTGDAEALARCMEELLADPDEARRRSHAALERAASYTWEESARAHAALYRSLLGVPAGS